MELATIHQPQTLSMKSCLDCPKGNYHKTEKRNLQKVKTQVRTLHPKFHNYRACKSSSDCIIIEDAASSFRTYILPFMVYVQEKFFALAFCLVSHKSRFLAWVRFSLIKFFFLSMFCNGKSFSILFTTTRLLQISFRKFRLINRAMIPEGSPILEWRLGGRRCAVEMSLLLTLAPTRLPILTTRSTTSSPFCYRNTFKFQSLSSAVLV